MAEPARDINWRIDECVKVYNSFEYFLDTYVYIEDKENNRAVKLELWPMQRDVIKDLVNELLLVLLKTRQVGLTWLSAALVLWLSIRNPLFLALIISVNEDLSIEFLNRVYFIQYRLPIWLCPPVKTKTKQVLEFQHDKGLVSTVKSMPTTEMGAQSKTPNILILDETCMNRMIAEIFNSSYPGIEQAKGRVIVISNSIKRGPGWAWTRDLYANSMSGINKFKRIFLPWQAHPGRPANFRKMMENAGMDAEDVIQHYPETEEEAISALASSYFGDALGRHNQHVNGTRGRFEREKDTNEVYFLKDDPKKGRTGGIVELWRHPYFLRDKWDKHYWKHRYAAGADVSEGLGGSYSVGYVIDRKLDEIVCRIRSNRIDAHTWATQLNMMADYYERACICVESTGAGQTTVKRLEELKANQYVRVTSGVVGSGLTKVYGWHESQSSKHELCGDLRRWLKEMTGILYDKMLIDECQTFIQLENGTLDHEPGKLSDCVMAAGCTIQASKFLPHTEKIPHDPTGWRKRLIDEGKPSAWAA